MITGSSGINGTILLVHGTGVRPRDFQPAFEAAGKLASHCGITQQFMACPWGEALGMEFKGRSLPDPPALEQMRAEEGDFARWNWLFDDPLFELDKLTIRDPQANGEAREAAEQYAISNPGQVPEWERHWQEISGYQPSAEMVLLLRRGGLTEYWQRAWALIVDESTLPRQAFRASPHEVAEAARALSRALVAQMHVLAEAKGHAGPPRKLRDDMVTRLTVDWRQHSFGVGTFLWNRLERAATRVLREHRNSFSDGAALPIGDILLYQSRGETIRNYIRKKIEAATPPVYLLAHSLGGIACFDLLALPSPPKVECFITAGSQSPLLYEIGALLSLQPPQPLPPEFPMWLNFYDRNDFLSYVGNQLFPVRDFELQHSPDFSRDHELESGQPFPASHSAYFGNEILWEKIGAFIAASKRSYVQTPV